MALQHRYWSSAPTERGQQPDPMFTLRALPPVGGACVAGNALIDTYHAGLRRHWPRLQTALAELLCVMGRGGWSDSERRILSDAVRREGLSMADRKGLHRLLNPGAFPAESCALRNKALFARRVRDFALPAAQSWFPNEEPLGHWLEDQADIIAKPSFQSKGRGVERFIRDGANWPDSANLIARLEKIVRSGGVVQQCVATHPDLALLSPGALPTLRVMTCIDEEGRVEPCDRALRLSVGGPRPVDNFNAGNLVGAIEGDGRISRVWQASMWGGVDRVELHPTTGATLIGQQLPELDAAIALAVTAHEHFRDGFTVIGWDIGLSDAGPVLIEGNWNPGSDILQLVNGRGLAAGRLGALYRHHLTHLSATQWRAARAVERDRRRA